MDKKTSQYDSHLDAKSVMCSSHASHDVVVVAGGNLRFLHQLPIASAPDICAAHSMQHTQPHKNPGQQERRPCRCFLTCRAGASLLHVHVRLSVVSTGTATVSTGTRGLYLATSLPVLPPRVNTTIKLACTCSRTVQGADLSVHVQPTQLGHLEHHKSTSCEFSNSRTTQLWHANFSDEC